MAFPPVTNSWPRVSLSPPVPPVFPDFSLCHPFYGQRLLPYACNDAAIRLPLGNSPIQYNVQHPYEIPTQIQGEDLYGDCTVLIQSTDLGLTLLNPAIAPDAFRAMASWIISQCVGPHGLGGFGTVMLENVIDWIADDATNEATIEMADWPSHAIFYTVTVTSISDIDRIDPFYFDPATAGAIADGVRQKGNNVRADVISKTTEYMTRGTSLAWWTSFEPSSSEPDSDTEMVYTCDAKLGVPSSVDCNQLAYSGLGPPSDSLTISPGSGTKFLSFNTCKVGITAATTITLTWAQIQAGLSTLIDQCVTHPFLASQGGRAFAQTVPSSKMKRRRKVGEKRNAPPLSGFNALPLGITITLLK